MTRPLTLAPSILAPSILAFGILALAAGCRSDGGVLETRSEKIELQGDRKRRLNEKKFREAERLIKVTYADRLREDMELEQKRALGRDLEESERRREERDLAVNTILDSIDEDPFASFESDRKRVLDRKFTDTRNDIEPEDAGDED